MHNVAGSILGMISCTYIYIYMYILAFLERTSKSNENLIFIFIFFSFRSERRQISFLYSGKKTEKKAEQMLI